MSAKAYRERVRFPSGDSECAAWHYPGNGACIVMGTGLGVPKEPGTDPLASRFAQEGFTVLAFDYRRFGESGGHPRQVFRVGEQLEDWRAAVRHARALPQVDPARIALWGFSAGGGHVLRVAERDRDLAAAVCHAGLADGVAGTLNALRHVTPRSLARLTAMALVDALRGYVGREPLLVPLAAPKGTVASLNTPDSLNGEAALDPGGSYPSWQREVAARSVVRVGLYRPGRVARRIDVPLLVLVHEEDGVSLAEPAAKVARRAPRGELVRLPGGHYQTFLDGIDLAIEAMLPFLRRHLLDDRAAKGEPALAAGTAHSGVLQRPPRVAARE